MGQGSKDGATGSALGGTRVWRLGWQLGASFRGGGIESVTVGRAAAGMPSLHKENWKYGCRVCRGGLAQVRQAEPRIQHGAGKATQTYSGGGALWKDSGPAERPTAAGPGGVPPRPCNTHPSPTVLLCGTTTPPQSAPLRCGSNACGMGRSSVEGMWKGSARKRLW